MSYKKQDRGSRGKFVRSEPWYKFIRECENLWKDIARKLGLYKFAKKWNNFWKIVAKKLGI